MRKGFLDFHLQETLLYISCSLFKATHYSSDSSLQSNIKPVNDGWRAFLCMGKQTCYEIILSLSFFFFFFYCCSSKDLNYCSESGQFPGLAVVESKAKNEYNNGWLASSTNAIPNHVCLNFCFKWIYIYRAHRTGILWQRFIIRCSLLVWDIRCWK